jgi:hypothetical protein
MKAEERRTNLERRKPRRLPNQQPRSRAQRHESERGVDGQGGHEKISALGDFLAPGLETGETTI